MSELLNQKEQRVLGCLYKLNQVPVSHLAKETNINRTSLYPMLEKLIEKGLVSAFTQEGTTLYEPIDYDAFQDWLQNKKKEVENQTTQLQTWLEEVISVNQAPSLVSKIKYFEGFDGLKSIYSDSWRNNASKQIYAITDVQAAVDTAEEFFRKEYMPARIAHGIHVKDIMTESSEAEHEINRNQEQLRDIRMAKGLFKDLGIEINLYDNKTMIAAYDKEKPAGVIIENEKITDAMKNIFEYLWQTTPAS
jgi:sugar-specific transcriptional regulator TrmB